MKLKLSQFKFYSKANEKKFNGTIEGKVKLNHNVELINNYLDWMGLNNWEKSCRFFTGQYRICLVDFNGIPRVNISYGHPIQEIKRDDYECEIFKHLLIDTNSKVDIKLLINYLKELRRYFNYIKNKEWCDYLRVWQPKVGKIRIIGNKMWGVRHTMGITIYNKSIDNKGRRRDLENIIALELNNIQSYQEFATKLKDILLSKDYHFMTFEILELNIMMSLSNKGGVCLYIWNPNPSGLTDYMHKIREERDIDIIIKIISRFLNNYK